MPKSRGYRRKTRSLLTQKPRERGKPGLGRLLHGYEPGDQVVIELDPSVHRGMPHRRYHGKVGVIVSKRGRSYEVEVAQGDAARQIIVRPEHLRLYKGE